jgi:hypothetical protein
MINEAILNYIIQALCQIFRIKLYYKYKYHSHLTKNNLNCSEFHIG